MAVPGVPCQALNASKSKDKVTYCQRELFTWRMEGSERCIAHCPGSEPLPELGVRNLAHSWTSPCAHSHMWRKQEPELQAAP